MDLKHKHWALIVIGVLVAILIILGIWFAWRAKTAQAPTQNTASSTSAVVAQPVHLTEHTAYYDTDLTYPSATPLVSVSADANAKAVATMKKFAQDSIAQFKQDGNFANLTPEDIKIIGFSADRKYALSSEYKTYTGARTVSYSFLVYADTLGAHPNSYYKTFTFDTQTGAELSLSDLFRPSVQYLTLLSNRARVDLPGIITNMGSADNNFADTNYIKEGTQPIADNFSAFYIEGKSLVLIFAPYQVGPYALGTVLDPIPLAQIGDSLKPEYR